MTGPRPAEILQRLAGEAASDADLLRRFATTRDGAAFEELVRRHGPVVFAACRRGVRHHHDAEDAFQAVFLVLARRAGAVDRPEFLGSWLYRVAVRVAGHARRAAARRRVREVQAVDVPEPAVLPSAPADDFGPVVDEEVGQLAAHHRDVVILCDLQGLSRAAAADALGIPLGTLASRLDAARRKLAVRLVRRGVTLSVAAMLVESRAVAVPTFLLSRACEVVATWAAGSTLPQTVLKLAQGGFVVRRTLLLGLVTAVATTVVGVGLAARTEPPRPAPPAPPAAADRKADQAPAAAPGFVFTPRPSRAVDLPVKDAQHAMWSPDGARLAVVGLETVEKPDRKGLPVVHVEPVYTEGDAAAAIELDRAAALVGFVPGSPTPVVVTALREYRLVSGLHRLDFWHIRDAPQKGVQQFPTRHYRPQRSVDLDPGATAGYAFAADGASYRTVRNPDRQKGGRVEVQEMSLDPARPGTRPVAGEPGLRGDLTAGGRVLLVTEAAGVAASEVPSGRRLWRRAFGPGQGVNYPVGSAGGEVVAVIHENFRVTTLDGRTGEPLPPLEGVEQVNITGLGPQNVSAGGRLVAFTFSTLPDLAAGNSSGTIAVWNVRTGQRVQSWRGTATVAFHPTRPVLAVLEPNGDRTRLGLWGFAAQP